MTASLPPAPLSRRKAKVMTDLVEKVAKAIDEVQLWLRHNDWTSDRVEGLPWEVCRHGSETELDIIVIERFAEGVNEQAALRAVISQERARAAIRAVEADRAADEFRPGMFHNEEAGHTDLLLSDEPYYIGPWTGVQAIVSLKTREIIGFRHYEAPLSPRALPLSDGESE